MEKRGIPRASENVYYRQYKKAKTAYRKAQRRAVWEYEREEFNDIANFTELDHETFWKLINTKVRRKKKKEKVVALEVDNAVLTNLQVVADLWANYYEKLAIPPEHVNQEDMKSKVDEIFEKLREGISLLPCINQMLKRIVLSRLQKEEKYSHQREQDALTTSFVIDEVVNHCREEKEKVYVAYMDITKAFDTMWIDAMLFKLHYNKGIAGKTWRLIKIGI
ncbi:Hypothetical predicted protein [Paramuricea clavata]|uniref:Uncharacterized protein n=1 Tax=Paramuricea clavata TaxID=317549 RepID=A0A6S7IFG1_PARCT|nr:Hypothetical predicted protein [Paramuricea clavata]